MSLLSPPASRGGQPPEDVDRRLRAFFRAQMPDPWPTPDAPRRRPLPPDAARLAVDAQPAGTGGLRGAAGDGPVVPRRGVPGAAERRRIAELPVIGTTADRRFRREASGSTPPDAGEDARSTRA